MTQKITHVCQGTCSRQIDVELENGVVRSVSFTGGCHGNHVEAFLYLLTR